MTGTLLKLDYDGVRYAVGYNRMRRVLKVLRIVPRWIRLDKTRHGWHCWVMVPKPLLPMEVVALQALCGDDPHRGAYNFARVQRVARAERAGARVPRFWKRRVNVLYKSHERAITL